MGILDGSYGGGLLDPNTASLLGLAAGLGQASGASRLPISMGQVMGSGIQGMLSGQQEALRANLMNQQLQTGQLNLDMLKQRYGLMQDAMSGTGAFAGGAGGGGTSPGMSAPQAAQTALSQGGGPTVANAQTMNALQQPTPSQQGGGFAGTSPGLYQRALLSEALIPGSGKTILDKSMPGYQSLRPGGYLLRPDGSLQQLPNIPQGMTVKQNPDGSFTAVDVPGARAGLGANAQVQQNAIQNREENVERFKYGLSTGEAPPNVGTGLPTGTTGAQAASPVAAATKRTDNGDIITPDRGTVVPSVFTNQKMGPGSDLINKQNTESINTEKNWAAVRPTIETQRSRLQVISNAFSDLEGKSFTEARADIANKLNGLGLKGAANMVMSQGNVADVQRVLWAGMQDVMAQLKTANAGSGGRILRAEFEAYMDHAFSPDQVGPALRTAVTQQLGTMYQMGNMIDDYYGTGRQNGWRDANQFQSAYLRKNPIEGFVNYAENTVPQFKGGNAPPTKPQYTEGMTATNPATKQRVIFRSGQWVPVQ